MTKYGVQFTQHGVTVGQWHATRRAAELHYTSVVHFRTTNNATAIKLIRSAGRGNETLKELT